MSVSQLIDKRLMHESSDTSMEELMIKCSEAVNESDFMLAEYYSTKLTTLWPDNVNAWYMLSNSYFKQGKYELGVQALLHFSDLPKGINLIISSKLIDKNEKDIELQSLIEGNI